MGKLITQKGTEIYKLTAAKCNIYVIRKNKSVILTDTGMSFDRNRLEHALERDGIVPEAVVLTHTHFDHAGNAAWLARKFGATIIVQEKESEALASGDTPIPSGTYAFTKGLVSIGRKMNPVFRYEPCTADFVFDETCDLNRYGINGYLIHTPGHSPGGTTAVIDAEVALAGDSIIGSVPGNPFPPFADDVDELVKSWKKILDTGCTTFLPGHGKPVTREEIIREYEEKSKNLY